MHSSQAFEWVQQGWGTGGGRELGTCSQLQRDLVNHRNPSRGKAWGWGWGVCSWRWEPGSTHRTLKTAENWDWLFSPDFSASALESIREMSSSRWEDIILQIWNSQENVAHNLKKKKPMVIVITKWAHHLDDDLEKENDWHSWFHGYNLCSGTGSTFGKVLSMV
jgi:hypothetical protein